MESENGLVRAHSAGEVQSAVLATVEDPVTVVDTLGRRIRVEWDPLASVTPMGQLVYFAQFLATAGLFSDWVRNCPLVYTSSNAPAKQDVLGTLTLAILAGHHRYAHITALRCDKVNPVGLGMSQVCSEDSVRLAFKGLDPALCAQWQQQALAQTWEPLLKHGWILDMDMTVKPIYGHQEGAQIGYNPHKPGRPCHALHTWFVRKLRLVLDVEVLPGKQHSAKHGQRRETFSQPDHRDGHAKHRDQVTGQRGLDGVQILQRSNAHLLGQEFGHGGLYLGGVRLAVGAGGGGGSPQPLVELEARDGGHRRPD